MTCTCPTCGAPHEAPHWEHAMLGPEGRLIECYGWVPPPSDPWSRGRGELERQQFIAARDAFRALDRYGFPPPLTGYQGWHS